MPHNIIRTISKSGLCSRKQALDLVMSGKVKIKGRTVLDPGTMVTDPGSILVGGKPLSKAKKIYILFNKPAGYVTTRQDELGRPTVYEFLKDVGDWVFPVGRLDLDSEGLLIFTNDTEFGNVLTEPRYRIERTYEVLIDSPISDRDVERMLKGVYIGRGEKSEPTKIEILDSGDGEDWVQVSLRGGKNREIRRMFEAIGRKVKRLVRIKYGPFTLGAIKPGKWAEAKSLPAEITKIINR